MHQLSAGENVNVSVREIYRGLQKAQTHLVQSTEIATAGVCQHLFKLSYPFGVVRGERDYLVANAVHDIMSIAIHGPILENWVHKPKELTAELTESIVRDSSSITEQVTKDTKEYAIKEARVLPESFDHDVADRFRGLVTGITKYLMRKYEQPKSVLTEVTVTNILSHHEGRIDAILEFDNGGYGILDWKTYNINRANGSGHERWQLLSNMLLSNFRYTNNEDDWSKFLFASIVYYEGAYMPRLPIPEKHITKIKNDRFFAHQVLCGNYVRAEKPRFCPVCDTNAEGCSDCRFYREDAKMAFAGQLPDNYRKITGQLFSNRYKVLQERAETHRHKHVVDTMTNSLGEEAAIRELERCGILHSGYKFVSSNGTMVRFRNVHEDTFLEPKKVLRVIGKEDNISLLSCISEQATVMEANDFDLVLSFRSQAIVERARLQLFKLPLIMLRDEINLTRRMLEPLHKFHRLAADFLVPRDSCCTNANGLEDMK
jgi:PD-(D/E)XK nuclease superfamily